MPSKKRKAVKRPARSVKQTSKGSKARSVKRTVEGSRSRWYRAIVRTLCKDGTSNTAHDVGATCSVAYGNAEKRNFRFCLVHGGVQKHTRVSCKPE